MRDSRRPRVLLLTTSLGYGGSESDFLRLARYLSKKTELKIALFSQDYGVNYYNNANIKTDIPIIILHDQKPSRGGIWSKTHKWWRLRKNLESEKRKSDVTISFLTGPNLLNALTGNPQRAIVSERGSKRHHVGLTLFQKWVYLKILDPLIYRRVARIVPASKDYGLEVAEVAGPRYSSKIVPIEGSITADDLLAQVEAPVDQDIERFCWSAPVAVFCSRLDRGKGIDVILPAFARVRHRMPSARFLVIGDGPLLSNLQYQCSELGLQFTNEGDESADVFFAGYRANPLRHFRLCRVFIFPSLHEGLPNALIEGVASGIPVLAADCPWGPRSILAAPGDGSLPNKLSSPTRLAYGTLLPVPDAPDKIRMWEEEIHKALSTPLRRRSMTQRRAAIFRFDVNETGPKWTALINDIIAKQDSC